MCVGPCKGGRRWGKVRLLNSDNDADRRYGCIRYRGGEMKNNREIIAGRLQWNMRE